MKIVDNSKKFDIGSSGGSIFIIAELSGNHGRSLGTAIKTVKAAKMAGADAIKLQTYTPDTITMNCKNNFFKINSGSLWDGQYLYELYQQAYTPWEWHDELFRVAREEGLFCFSSPFDLSAVDFLEKLNTPAYKIASPEIVDIPLIQYVASKGKPVIISTGIATEEDVKLAVDTCLKENNRQIALLKCTTAYPAPISKANLATIQEYKKRFNVIPGLSDHTLGITVPILSVAMGAKIIEKHFIIDKSIGGADASFSLNYHEFKKMVESVREAEKAIGRIEYAERKNVKGQGFSARSLFVIDDLKKGDKLTNENIKSIRPGFGLHPKYYEQVLGETVKKEVPSGTPLSWDLIQ